MVSCSLRKRARLNSDGWSLGKPDGDGGLPGWGWGGGVGVVQGPERVADT